MAQSETELYLDFDGCIKILKSKGKEVDSNSTIKEIGYTRQAFGKIKKKAPKSIEMVYRYLKANGLELGDLVKERQ